MKTEAAQFTRFGDPAKVLEVVEVKIGAPDKHEVIVAVEASPIHNGDLYNIAGVEGFRLPLPHAPGIEGVGRIAEVGKAVKGWRAGDRVVFHCSSHDSTERHQSGAWQRQVRLGATGLIPAPKGAAAQLAHSLNAMTADLLLRDTLDLKNGEWLLQNAANSNVGRYVVSLAKLRGYKTANVVRRAAQADGLTALGADVVVVDGPDLAEDVARVTGGADIRFGIDAVAGKATGRPAECLADGGTIFTYGLMSGEPCQIQPRILFQKDLRLRGYYMGRPLRTRSPEAQRDLFADLAALMADGTLVAEIAGTYPLRDVRSAARHAAMSGADRVGKVLVAPSLS